jgi:hypothetical protein
MASDDFLARQERANGGKLYYRLLGAPERGFQVWQSPNSFTWMPAGQHHATAEGALEAFAAEQPRPTAVYDPRLVGIYDGTIPLAPPGVAGDESLFAEPPSSAPIDAPPTPARPEPVAAQLPLAF